VVAVEGLPVVLASQVRRFQPEQVLLVPDATTTTTTTGGGGG
jgi:pyridoxine 5'-phosphate synthase PdxJ